MNGHGQIDRQGALNWLEGDEAMLVKMKAIFMKNIPSQVKLLEQFLAADDNNSTERAAHTIMGSSAMLGATVMSEAARKIEQSAMDGNMAAARIHFASFSGEYQKVMAELLADGGV